MIIPNTDPLATAAEYRYGFNGMEKDNELKGGDGKSYDFGARMYDSRIGRWFKTDPLSKKYPYDSPYMFAGNSPVILMDPDGERKRKVVMEVNEKGELTKVTAHTIDYSLKAVTRKIGYDMFGDIEVTEDYYDTVDLTVIVRDAKGKILSTNTEMDMLGDLRFKGDGIWHTPGSIHQLNDWIENGIGTEDNDPLQGNSKGHFKGGLDLRINDAGNILNIRGLEKLGSTPDPQIVDISEIYVYMSGQTGAPVPKAIADIKLSEVLNNVSKGIEHAEAAAKKAIQEYENMPVNVQTKKYEATPVLQGGYVAPSQLHEKSKDTVVKRKDIEKVNKQNNERKKAAQKKVNSNNNH